MKIQNLIAGRLVPAASGAEMENIDPSVGGPYGTVPDSDATDTNAAVDAAANAFDEWAAAPAAERSAVLMRIADLIDRDLERLAMAECVDNGKPLKLARSVDIPRASANFRFFAGAILHTRSDAHLTDARALNYTRRDPLGVVGLISPWNLPLYLLSWKIAPALATGNTAVAKPSEVTPATAHLLAELCIEAGLPAGVLNIVHGLGPKVGAALVDHPDIAAISFTGGTATGRAIARSAAPRFRKLALEMGGKNPTVVFDDADLEQALPGAVRAAFANQGQICLCGSRLLVQRSIADRFTEQVVERAKRLLVGDPLDSESDQGAVVSAAHLQKVSDAVEQARTDGGQVLCGGGPPETLPQRCRDGFFYMPTVIAGLDHTATANQEEIFGPVVTIIPFDDEDHAIEIANSTRYGLAASVWTRDLDRAHRVAQRLESGTIWINCWLLRDLRVPFGGMKQSGVGREGGEEALRFFTEPKNVCVGFAGQ